MYLSLQGTTACYLGGWDPFTCLSAPSNLSLCSHCCHFSVSLTVLVATFMSPSNYHCGLVAGFAVSAVFVYPHPASSFKACPCLKPFTFTIEDSSRCFTTWPPPTLIIIMTPPHHLTARSPHNTHTARQRPLSISVLTLLDILHSSLRHMTS